MGKISLRAYNKEIETLIDRGATDEAIANSKYILQSYPKCIATYRNLAKALLESKRYPEAEDIFNRVLSAFPDDFISHIGISIIKENEGNLDAAIWHMELAYDVQPSNPALTNELRRLFGRRDGVQPPKIRLTRGALIRMYARGELFQQAISEIHSALQADARRIDLEVILADMYYYSGALVDAAATCSNLLSRLPYCFEANLLMMQIVPRTSEADSAKVYRNRLAELDPYYAFITSPETLSDEIDQDQVLLDHYAGEGSSYEENQGLPRTSEADWEKITESEKLYWIEDKPDQVEKPTRPLDYSPEDILEASITRSLKSSGNESVEPDAASNVENIPDWMRSAGWVPATHSEEELLDNSEPPTENISYENPEIRPGELPDWLNHISPSEPVEQDSQNEIEMDTEMPMQPESVVPSETVLEPDLQEPDLDTQDSVSTEPNTNTEPAVEYSTPEQGETGEKMPTDSSTNNENEWLNQFRNDSPNKGEESDLPDWLKDFEAENEQPIEGSMDIPEWLKSLEPLEPAAGAVAEGVEPSGQGNEVFPKEDTEESAITGTSYLFTKNLTDDEIKAGQYDTAYISPEEQSSPSNWEAPAENVPEIEAEASDSAVLKQEAYTPPAGEDLESAISGTGVMFTKALSEEEVQSGRLDATYLTPEAPSLPSDWEETLEKSSEPPVQPSQETKPSLPAWVMNALKGAPAAGATPAAVTPTSAPSPLPVAPPPMPAAVPVEPSKSSILDQLNEIPEPAQKVEPELPEEEALVSLEALGEETPLAGVESAKLEPTSELEPEISSETAQAETTPSFEELGEEPIEDLVSGQPAEGAISEGTNTELLDWLRGFNESEEPSKEGQPAVEEPSAISEGLEENPLDRLGEFVMPEEEAAVTGVSEAPEAESVDQVAESIQETVILPDEVTPEPQTSEQVETGAETAVPEIGEIEPQSEQLEEAAATAEVESVPEPVEETNVAEFAQAEEPTPEAPTGIATEPETVEVPSEPLEFVREETVAEGTEADFSEQLAEPVEVSQEEAPAPEPALEIETMEHLAEVAKPVESEVSETAQVPRPVVPDPLEVAASALESGDMTLAINEFAMAIQDESKLQAVTEALKSATKKHAEEDDLWQLLGDAYARTSSFDEAFAAYDKAESLLLNQAK